MNDLRFALRQLRKSPGFTLTAVVTLALGIGASTTIFSVINSVLLEPLPFPRADRLYQISETNAARDIAQFSVSVPNFIDWRERSQSWAGLAATKTGSANLSEAGEPAHLLVQYATADFWPMMGYRPLLGRAFNAEEDRPGHNRVVILAQHTWHRIFGGDLDVIGRVVSIDGEPHEIVGIAPAEFALDSAVDAFAPLGADLAREGRGNKEMFVVGRLRDGVSPGQAEAELRAIAIQLAQQFPESNRDWSVRLDPFGDSIVSPSVRRALWVLLGGATLLLFIACANVSNLLLGRAYSRTREFAIRMALGGDRVRLARHLLTDSLLLAVLGGLGGFLLATWTVDLLRALDPAQLPRAAQLAVDARVATFAAFLALVTGALAGLAPIFQTVRVDVQNSLKASGHSVTTSRSRMRDALVIAQIGLSVVLLIGGGLLARSFDRLVRQDLGFDATNVLTFRLSPVSQDPSLYARLLPRIAALPGIERVGLTSAPPFSSSNTSLDLTPVEPSRLAPAQAVQCDWRMVSGDYFEALRVPLRVGRTFTPADNPDAPRVIMINETLARTVWGDENPVGKRVRLGSGTSENTIIGVVADFRHRTPDLAPTPAFFFSAYRVIQPQMTVMLRAHIPSERLLPSIRAVVRELDPALPLHGVQMLSDLGGESVARQRLQTTLFATLSVVAAALSLVGLYSVIAFSVAQRTREIGIRMALGARRSQIVRLIGTEGARLSSLGLALGILASLGASRFLESMLFAVTAADPWIYGGVAFLLGIVALTATLLPARRAARVDPIIALRAE